MCLISTGVYSRVSHLGLGGRYIFLDNKCMSRFFQSLGFDYVFKVLQNLYMNPDIDKIQYVLRLFSFTVHIVELRLWNLSIICQ